MKALLFLSLVVLSFAVFENTEVVVLNGDNFDAEVTDSSNLWLVVFHDSKVDDELVTTVEQTALALRNMFNVGAVNDAELVKRFNVVTLPAFLVFGAKKDQPQRYEETKFTAENLVNFVFEQARHFTFDRIGAKTPKKKVEDQKTEEVVEEEDVVTLDDDSFEDTVRNSKDAWIIEFYAPWCDHCKTLVPEWSKLGTLLKGEIKVAKIDSSKNTKAHEKYKVKGYPSIKFFPAGDKLEGEWEDYDGARDAASMAQWAREAKRRLRPLYLEQLTSQQQFKQNCLEYSGICVIFFVPHILDTGKEGREKYLKTFRDAVLPHKQKPFNYFWSQGADQYDFEEIFGLGGAGYPSVLAISPKKQVWSKMRASFNQANVDRFIQNLIRGKEQVAPYRKQLEIKNAKVWDPEN